MFHVEHYAVYRSKAICFASERKKEGADMQAPDMTTSKFGDEME